MNALDLAPEFLMGALVQAAMDAVLVVDADERLNYVNPAAERMFGATATVLCGQPVAALIPLRYVEAYRTALDNLDGIGVAEPTLPGTWRIEVRRADGSEFPVEVSVARERSLGRWRHVLILRDVAPRVRTEAALRDSENRFRSLADQAPIMIWECGADGAVHYCNRAALNFTGLPLERQLGAGWSYAIHGEDRAAAMDSFRAALDAGGPFLAEFRYRRADGAWRWVRATGAPRTDVEGCFLGLIGTTVDIDDWRSAEERQRRLAHELEARVARRTEQLTAANTDLEAFSYTIAHDLRAPLRAISVITRQLAERCASTLGEEGRNYLKSLERSSGRAERMVVDLLEVARVGRRRPAQDVVALDALATSVIDEVLAGLPVRPELYLDSLPRVRGDATLLRQALQNLLDNAVKFSARQPHARLEIRARVESGEFVLTVLDNGAGFDMAYADKLFGMFQRLHSESEFEGTGVGLAIVQRIAAHHGGRVWAESRVGEGAVFHFALPAARLIDEEAR